MSRTPRGVRGQGWMNSTWRGIKRASACYLTCTCCQLRMGFVEEAVDGPLNANKLSARPLKLRGWKCGAGVACRSSLRGRIGRRAFRVKTRGPPWHSGKQGVDFPGTTYAPSQSCHVICCKLRAAVAERREQVQTYAWAFFLLRLLGLCSPNRRGSRRLECYKAMARMWWSRDMHYC